MRRRHWRYAEYVLRHAHVKPGDGFPPGLWTWDAVFHIASRDDGLGLDLYWWDSSLPSEHPSTRVKSAP